MSLKRAGAQAASAPPEDRLKSCEEFVRRAQKHFSQAELDLQTDVKNRDQMQAEFEEGQRTLVSLEAEVQNPQPPVPSVRDMEAETRQWREQMAQVEGTSTTQERPRVRQRVSASASGGFIPEMPELVPGALYTWSRIDRRSSKRRWSKGILDECWS